MAWIQPRRSGFGLPCTSSLILRSIRRGRAFDFCGMGFAFGDGTFGFCIRLASNVLGLIVRLHANGLSFRLQGLLACFGDDRAFRSISAFVGFAIGCLHYKLRNRNLR